MKLIGFTLAVALALAASPDFEAASIRPVNPSTPAPGRLTVFRIVTNPGRLTARNANLRDLVTGAWGIEDYQVQGGPVWTLSARFDIEARAAGTADRGQLLLMLRAMLAERCKLAVHRETKELAIYALVVAKNGPKFRTLSGTEASCWPRLRRTAAHRRTREFLTPPLTKSRMNLASSWYPPGLRSRF